MLRGLLEEQEYRLKKLEQDQLDRYQDIDRRLSALSAGSPAPSGDSGSASPGLAPVTPSTQNQTSNTPPAEADPEREKLLYEAAFEQVRLRDF
ncbi:MAG: YbgF trimerization domain-containing protein, partial [Pseudomonadaceae bacterium]|nr:YbgF trimerization domain-containing protein [Pseudomonadaceae bacterium]